MARQQYPLEALRTLRDERAEAQARDLAAQLARSSAAQLRLAEKERARREQGERTAASVRSERERLAAGLGSGADLQRCVEFEAGAAAQAALLLRAEAEARQALAHEREQEQKLREELAKRDAEAQLVRNHQARFHEQAADAALRAEEEVALEQWNARRR
jgi:hypothetical protein